MLTAEPASDPCVSMSARQSPIISGYYYRAPRSRFALVRFVGNDASGGTRGSAGVHDFPRAALSRDRAREREPHKKRRSLGSAAGPLT